MNKITLFRIDGENAKEIAATASDLEKPLQRLIEKNLEPLLSVRFLATEYSTGKTHAGRIDTLGIDENHCPVILEYKRSSGENVINQGLFYLDWLMDHRAEFKLLVLDAFGKAAADEIDWAAPRLICIAADFTKYDAHAVQQINRGIELFRYRQFGPELLLLELTNAVSPKTPPAITAVTAKGAKAAKASKDVGDQTVMDWFAEYPLATRDLFDSLESFITSLGDDVQRKDLKLYVAFKRIKNFASVVPQKDRLLLMLHLNPDKHRLTAGFTRDVRKIGHWGTGDLEVSLKSLGDLEKAKTLIQQAYRGETLLV
ncbi:MAG: DUF5655 domain-containing protein [Reyranella sp.]|nr:DUF5655 domain-containing protein [Reyranella sp.]MDP3158781.1 DUF5655 domain-containing protein [Reyranella sp.]